MEKFIKDIVREQGHLPQNQTNIQQHQVSSPDSAMEAFIQQSDQQLQPMEMRNKRLTVPDDGSAIFGKDRRRNPLAHNNLLEGAIKVKKCQIMRDCMEPSIGVCTEQEYRGCTLSFCEQHSGVRNRKKKEIICCRPCSRDKHEDICQECSSDLLQKRFSFYLITLVLSVIIFTVLLTLVHLVLQSMPDFCQPSPGEGEMSICSYFQSTLHSLNPYTQNSPINDLAKANTALHMFTQIKDSEQFGDNI